MAEQGHKGSIKIYVSAALAAIGGMFNWKYSGEIRESEEIVEYGSDVALHEPTILKGGVISAQGNCKKGDVGYEQAKSDFDAGTKLDGTKVQFFVNDVDYYAPDATSTVYISKFNGVDHEASGTCRVEMEFQVSGQLEKTEA